MRRLALAIALACVLSGVARAGEIPTTGVVATPTPIPMKAAGGIPIDGAMTIGEIHSSDAIGSEDSSTLLTIILTLITVVS
jgi:hypothetical protein